MAKNVTVVFQPRKYACHIVFTLLIFCKRFQKPRINSYPDKIKSQIAFLKEKGTGKTCPRVNTKFYQLIHHDDGVVGFYRVKNSLGIFLEKSHATVR